MQIRKTATALLFAAAAIVIGSPAEAQQANVPPGDLRNQILKLNAAYVNARSAECPGVSGTHLSAKCQLAVAIQNNPHTWAFRAEEQMISSGAGWDCIPISGSPDNLPGPGFFCMAAPAAIVVTQVLDNMAKLHFCSSSDVCE